MVRATEISEGYVQPGAGDSESPRHHDREWCGICISVDRLPRNILPVHGPNISPAVFAHLWDNALKEIGIPVTTACEYCAECFVDHLYRPLQMRVRMSRGSRNASYIDMKKIANDLWPKILRDEAENEKHRDALLAQNENDTPLTPREIHEQNCVACKILKPLETAGTPVWQGGRSVMDFSVQFEIALLTHQVPFPSQMLGECMFYRLLTPIQLMLQNSRGLDPSKTPYLQLVKAAIELEAQSTKAKSDLMDRLKKAGRWPPKWFLPFPDGLVDLSQAHFADLTLAGIELAATSKAATLLPPWVHKDRIIRSWVNEVDDNGWDEADALVQLSEIDGK
jgi:hypothetical protein